MFDSNGVVFDDNVSCLMTNSAVVCSVSRARVHSGEFCVPLSRVYTHMLPCEVPDEIRYSIRIYLIPRIMSMSYDGASGDRSEAPVRVCEPKLSLMRG